MPDGSTTPPDPKQPDVNRQDAANAPTAKAGANASTPDPNKPEDAKSQDPLKDLIERLDGARSYLSVRNPRLAVTIGQLAEQSNTPGRLQDPGFRTRVAYALQDAEKLLRPLVLDQPLREELTGLAGTAPGLKNERMQHLLQSTTTITDNKLIAEIRSRAFKVAQASDQNAPAIESQVDVLENRVRLTPRTPSPAVNTAGDPGYTGSQSTGQEGAARTEQSPTAQGQPQQATQQQPPTGQASAPQQAQYAQAPQTITRGAGALVNVLSAMRSSGPATPPPWDNGPQVSLVQRHTRFEQKMQLGRDEQSFRATEKSGQAALDALQGFANGPGATMLTRIQDAANANPGGMQAVLSEMREGGRYAELRQQFNSALVAEKGFGAAYDRAASALAHYGDNRSVVDQILSRRADAAALSGRFNKMDAEIGQAAAAIPGRNEGKSTLDELANKAAEIVKRTVETVRAAFSRSPSADVTSRPSPSPSL
jgi:hypothetical protein